MPKFRKKPVVIEAIQWRGFRTDLPFGRFMDGSYRAYRYDGDALLIETLEGTMRAEVGDWIIRGVHGELYPCKPDIFAVTYEEVSDDA